MWIWAAAAGWSVAVFLIVWHICLMAQLRKINRVVEEIQQGNDNQRLRLGTVNAPLRQLGANLNRLLDRFQSTSEHTLYLEEERKRMVADISHDLRTPLTSMLGYLEAMEEDRNLSAEERKHFLRIVMQKGNTLSALLQDFFELAKLEADDPAIQLQPVNLTEIVQETVLSFYQDLAQAGITPELQIPERRVLVLADPHNLERIISNLLVNALRYGRYGGVLGVTVREEPERVWVDIWDRGRGIPTAALPYVFDRHFTGDSSRNSALKGSGLGLTIAKKLVEKQGGQISVASIPHEKTTFSFFLGKPQAADLRNM